MPEGFKMDVILPYELFPYLRSSTLCHVIFKFRNGLKPKGFVLSIDYWIVNMRGYDNINETVFDDEI